MDAASDELPRPSVHFAGLVLNLDACTLTRETGEPIALSRGALTLLREFVRRPGRVLSRDQLLDAVAGRGRRAEAFDRSIDVLVGRLRRKIEPDSKQPRLIVTVPGEGYRFSATLSRPNAAIPPEQPGPAEEPRPAVSKPSAASVALNHLARWRRVRHVSLAATFCLVLPVIVAAWKLWPTHTGTVDSPGVIVLPFEYLSGDATQDYVGTGVAAELTTLLGSFPSLRVVSSSAAAAGPELNVRRAAKAAGVQYVIHGGVHKLRDRLRFTAQLYDGDTGVALWANRFDAASADPFALQEDVANRIYDSLAGLSGRIRSDEVRISWGKSGPALDEYDYYVRGLSVFLRNTVPDALHARSIWQEGLKRFPDSALLRIKLAFSHVYVVMNEASKDPRDDVDQAWQLAKAAEAADSKSQLVTWALHWLMAFLYQWHDNDFVRSVTEARATVALVPYDALSRNDLSWILANAGHADEAIRWAQLALDHDPNGSNWYHGNLAWAYYVGHRYQEAYDAIREYSADYPALLAATLVRLDRGAQAHTVIADALKAGSPDTIALESLYPEIEPDRTAVLETMRAAGLPEK